MDVERWPRSPYGVVCLYPTKGGHISQAEACELRGQDLPSSYVVANEYTCVCNCD